MYIVRLYTQQYMCNSFSRIVAVITGPELTLSTGISVTVSVPSNEVHVVFVFVVSLI